MFSHQTSLRIRIAISTILSFVIVWFGAPYIFIADSPRVRSEVKDELLLAPHRLYALVTHSFDFTYADNATETSRMSRASSMPEDVRFSKTSSQTAMGVDKKSNTQYVRLSKGIVVEVHTVQSSDGRTVKVYMPK
jgi:hypothetical protein